MNGDINSGQLNRIESSLEAAVVLSRERFALIIAGSGTILAAVIGVLVQGFLG